MLRKKSSTNGNGSSKIGMHVVGPANPAARLDREGSTPDYRRWSSVRDTVVQIGKRMGVIDHAPVPKKKRSEGPLAPPTATKDEEAELTTGQSDFLEDFLVPPFDFSSLCAIAENSSSLRQNIDAMKTNIDGFGHQFESVIDFDSPEVNNVIRDLMIRKRIDDLEEPIEDLMDLTKDQLDELTPSIDEVEDQKQLWERIASLEKWRAQSFFEFVNPLEAFVEVRKETREHRELLGNSAWEVIRENPGDVDSKVCQIYSVSFIHIRLMRQDKEPQTVKMRIRKDLIRFEEIDVQRFFRRYVRFTGRRRVYYKEFGDPRVMSAATGKFYESVDVLKREEPEAQVANELFHWRVKSPVTPYGIPRWIGALISVLGSRASEEVNFLYFDNKAIPPMVLLVSGGRVSESSVEKLETYIEERVKGRENFHKIMVIEGLPADVDVSEGDMEHSGKLRLELKPLFGHQQHDALFQEYDANNITKIGRSFRQPQILTGDTRDMNRATAEVAKAFAEEQIYQPERNAFDACMDRHFLVNLGIHFWRFKSNAPVQRIPNDLVDNATKSLDKGAITPNEARRLLSDAFSFDFPLRTEDWADIPPRLAQAAARQGALPSVEPTMGEDESRAADQVGAQGTAEVIARGRTSVEHDHDHGFVALRTPEGVQVMLTPGGEDGHVHTVTINDEVPEGETVTLKTTGGVDHEHVVEFNVPLSKRARRARGFLAFLHALREDVQAEVEAAKDDFFSDSYGSRRDDDR